MCHSNGSKHHQIQVNLNVKLKGKLNLSFLTLKRPANPIFLWLLCCHFFQGENVQKAFRGRYFQNLQSRFWRVMQFEYGKAKKRRSCFKGSFWLKNKYRHFRLKQNILTVREIFVKGFFKNVDLSGREIDGISGKNFLLKIVSFKKFFFYFFHSMSTFFIHFVQCFFVLLWVGKKI